MFNSVNDIASDRGGVVAEALRGGVLSQCGCSEEQNNVSTADGQF